jgi:hypothetical protein
MGRMKRTLVIRGWQSGFVSNFNGVVNNLRYRLGRWGIEAALVEWTIREGMRQFPYGKPTDGNIWLHFFEPLPFEQFPSARREVCGYARWGMTSRYAYAMYKLDRHWQRDYHEVYRRYIKIKPAVLERVEAIQRAEMADHYCVGAHYRHPAHDTETLHPTPPPETFVLWVRRFLPADRPWKVVLATDFEPAVDIFRRAFGDRLVLQPGVRRSAGLGAHQLHHRNTEPDLALGAQVLIDCLLLSRCDSLVHINSNVATAAGYINPALKMVFCETAAQAAWGYVWSICLSKTGLVLASRMLHRAIPAVPRRTRKLTGLIVARVTTRLRGK